MIEYLPLNLKTYIFRLLNRKIKFGYNHNVHCPFLLNIGQKNTIKTGDNAAKL